MEERNMTYWTAKQDGAVFTAGIYLWRRERNGSETTSLHAIYTGNRKEKCPILFGYIPI